MIIFLSLSLPHSVGVIAGLEALIAPSLRSYIALLVKKEDIGKGNRLMNSFFNLHCRYCHSNILHFYDLHCFCYQ